MADFIVKRPGFRDILVRFVDMGAVPSQHWAEQIVAVNADGSPLVPGAGRTLLFAPIAQAGPGTDQILAAPGAGAIHIVSYVFVMSVAGTVKFTSGGDLTGAMDVVANSGVSAIGSLDAPVLKGADTTALSIVTTGGAARGHVAYFVE